MRVMNERKISQLKQKKIEHVENEIKSKGVLPPAEYIDEMWAQSVQFSPSTLTFSFFRGFYQGFYYYTTITAVYYNDIL
jgi:hypothetical protein